MIRELNQRWFFKKRKISIYETNLVLKNSNLTNLSELTIRYEEIEGNKEDYITSIKNFKLYIRISSYLTGFLFILSDITEYLSHTYIFSLMVFIGLILHHFITREKVWKIKLVNNTYIILNKKIPNEETVNDFIETLFRQRNQYLRETYLFVNVNMPYDYQFENLKWLRKIGVINTEEFNAMRGKLDALFNGNRRAIEFFLN
ncbi:MAG: hypothetical protein ACOVRN_08110 [Flavobacterium sp.]